MTTARMLAPLDDVSLADFVAWHEDSVGGCKTIWRRDECVRGATAWSSTQHPHGTAWARATG